MLLSQFLIGVYGGYFGAGIGILMLAAYGILGFSNIHQANAIKNLNAMFINGIAAALFIYKGLIDWPIAAAHGRRGHFRRLRRGRHRPPAGPEERPPPGDSHRPYPGRENVVEVVGQYSCQDDRGRFTAAARIAIVEANRPFLFFLKGHAMQPKHVILGVHINDRIREVQFVQQAFTEYGCYIKTRIGLHHVDEQVCSPRGLILLEMFGDESKFLELADKLRQDRGRGSPEDGFRSSRLEKPEMQSC